MTSIEEAKALVETTKSQVILAQETFLQSLGKEWRTLASDGFKRLAIELQPEVTQAKGNNFAEVKNAINQVIADGQDRIGELFRGVTDPETLVKQVRDRKYSSGPIEIKTNVYPSPVDSLAEPFHASLKENGYNPDLIKSSRGGSYSSTTFTESDFPIISNTARATYQDSITAYGKARFALASLQKDAVTSAATQLWEQA